MRVRILNVQYFVLLALDKLPGLWQHEPAMESTSDRRFDPNRAAQLLLDIAHEQSLEHLLQKVVGSAVEARRGLRPDLADRQGRPLFHLSTPIGMPRPISLPALGGRQRRAYRQFRAGCSPV
jgi:hypothetical protein